MTLADKSTYPHCVLSPQKLFAPSGADFAATVYDIFLPCLLH
jgi:hypothetical protein